MKPHAIGSRAPGLLGLAAALAVLGSGNGGHRAALFTAPAGTPVEAAGQGAAGAHRNAIIDLWAQNKTAFGVYVPDERPRAGNRARGGARAARGGDAAAGDTGRRGGRGNRGPRQPPLYTVEGGERLAQNPLYDFVFLNLEGAYDAGAVQAIAAGLRSPSAVGRKTLLVRIPPIERDGEEATRARVAEVLELGADGVVLPHVRSPEEARTALGFFAAAGADVWSPSNPAGEVIAMIMVEDPDATARVTEFADLPGYSILACGIGSLTAALGGDREAAEAANQRVLAEARRAGMADMITANAGDVEQRVREGFLALLMQGPSADEVIALGRAAAGR